MKPMTFDAEGTLMDDRRPETEAGRALLRDLDFYVTDLTTARASILAVEAQARERVLDELRGRPDFLDGARAEYRECMEARRLLGYLWNATGKNHLRPVHDLFADDDPIREDIERLAIIEELRK